MKHILSVTVSNQPAVLARISGLLVEETLIF